MVNHWKSSWANHIKCDGMLRLRIWICWFSYGGTRHEDLRHSISSNQWKNGVVLIVIYHPIKQYVLVMYKSAMSPLLFHTKAKTSMKIFSFVVTCILKSKKIRCLLIFVHDHFTALLYF